MTSKPPKTTKPLPAPELAPNLTSMLNPEAPPGMYLAQLGQTAHQEGLTGFMVVLFYRGPDDGMGCGVETEISGVKGADAYFGLRALGVRLDRDLFEGEIPDDDGEGTA